MNWDGTRWIDDPASPSSAPRRHLPRSRRAQGLITAVSAVALVSALTTSSVILTTPTSALVQIGSGVTSGPPQATASSTTLAFGAVASPTAASGMAATPTGAGTPGPTPRKPGVASVVTPTPRPAPTTPPTAKPEPTPRPTPNPKPPAGTAVPSSIDATGARDVSTALIDFLDGVPSGSTVVFRAGGTYRLDKAIKLAGRRNLTLEGHGATLRGDGGTTEASSIFWLVGGSGLTIEDFSLVGDSTSPGVYEGGREGAMGVLVDGGSGDVIRGCRAQALWGDFVEVNSGASGIHIYDNTVVNTGRNGLAVIWGNHVEFDHNTIERAGYVVFDVEPNTASEPASYIDIHDNHTGYWSDAFFTLDGSHTGAAIHDVTVADNVSTGYSLLTVVDSGGRGRDQRIAFTGNRSSVTARGPVLTFAHVDGLTVTGNHQSLSGGSLATISDCTAVTKDF